MLDPQTIVNQSAAHNHTHQPNRFAVVSIPEKLNAERKFTGKNVCIAFLDSGFYPHPDLIQPTNRIRAFHDVSGEETALSEVIKPEAWHWHGAQTTVVCAGSGTLSDNFYRGLASDAELVLVKVGEQGKITEKLIEKGLEWVLENRVRYNIRVLNISLGGDEDVACRNSRIDLLAEELVRQNVIVVAAAGNSGDAANPHSIPPANAPSVITVGGYSDENQLDSKLFKLYHSNYGATADGTVKPEIIAPAMFVAAPLLPNTEQYKTAEMLSWLLNALGYKLSNLVFEHWWQAGLPEPIVYQQTDGARRTMIEAEIINRKIVHAHYQHVDGTSFAAPVVSAIVAQMLEANPNLTAAAVKNILISTAERLSQFPAARQGYGMVHAARAVAAAANEVHDFDRCEYSPPRVENNKIRFSFHDDAAQSVHLVADFNRWKSNETTFLKLENGFWKAEIAILPAGKYGYKFLVDDERWTEDHSNNLKEADGFGGFNSILHVS